METIQSILIRRDGLTPKEADAAVADARRELLERIDAGDMPEDICEELFGLELDYLEQLL